MSEEHNEILPPHLNWGSYPVLLRDCFRCAYCDFDGKPWPNILSMTVDHLLPTGHPQRDDREFLVAACAPCNLRAGAPDRNLDYSILDRQALVVIRRKKVDASREEYRKWWEANVKDK